MGELVFTAPDAGIREQDDINSTRPAMVIEASWELDEAIVEDLVIPDHFRYGKDGAPKEKRAGTKDIFTKALPNGVVESAISDPEKIQGFCVDETQLDAQVQCGQLCERHFGSGRNIESGFKNCIVHLPQHGSITTGMPG